MQALQVLGEAWEEENLEIEGGSNGRTTTKSNRTGESVDLPNDTWDGVKEGTVDNAKMFMRMLGNVK